jgi:hypothetical protein
MTLLYVTAVSPPIIAVPAWREGSDLDSVLWMMAGLGKLLREEV